MSMSDPIADMLTRIRNAQLVKKKTVNISNSKINIAITKVLMDEGYIENYNIFQYKDSKKSEIIITLKYYLGDAVIENITRISKPGLRRYKSNTELPKVTNEMGIAIVSTSKGVMSARNAYQIGVGGELLCTVV
ncbi:MAG: 30S ribosomal protein S8 [Pseudomonadota bacterium]